ncbi:DivIVA domain-containing protein [Cronbergia sp. UHCC 0137]|uniref:DivIVA domain-containing protein n=1 Tax=Cronbergia sp. UHCC 0137 TaxID=3110239 RepID=UPI002B207579|nr:DivIVA domain-containing protein [Cronbergia sp. UHCC 0137]MEA5617761.1 DivIVA domain-containing protein [Cronbergia sp. UHCC 0137]
MLQPKFSNPESYQNGNNPPSQELPNRTVGVDIQQELNRLEDIIIAGLQIPLIGRTLIDEDKLIEQLDLVRVSLPSVFQEALEVLEQKQEILLEAEEYGQQLVEAAQAKRAQILAESDIIRHSEREAEQIRRQVQQECEAMMQETEAEIERKRRAYLQELEEMRQSAIAQAQEIEDGADRYADSVLENIEQDLKEMLRVITNGRQQLRGDAPPQRNSSNSKRR